MNIIERIIDIVQEFPKLNELSGGVHVDFADPEVGSFGLASMGDEKISEDVTGMTELRQHTFMLHAMFDASTDYERMANSGVLLELAVWLERQAGAELETEIAGMTYHGEIRNIRTANGMVYSIPQENLVDAVEYQLQIITQYTLEG